MLANAHDLQFLSVVQGEEELILSLCMEVYAVYYLFCVVY